MLKNQGNLRINLEAVVHNYNVLKAQAAGKTRTAAVVKANGYGLGAPKIGQALFNAGCRDFFVSSLEEGIVLRNALKTARIIVLNGFAASVGDSYADHNILPALGSFMEIEAYKKLSAKRGKKLEAYLSFNTRMNRLGLGSVETEKLLGEMNMLNGIHVGGILSHFACADEKGHPMNETQWKLFDDIAKHFPGVEKSLSNSSAVFRDTKYHYDLLRPGMALYGLNPTPETPNPMKPVVHLDLPVLRTRIVYAGATVGYGATYTFEKDTPIATVAAGYADGLFRSLSNKGAMYWKGIRCPIRGRVSMDLTTIDLSAVPEKDRPKPGDAMELIGEHQSADQLAEEAGTIGYEVLTSLGHRYAREYIGGQESIIRISGGRSDSARGA